MSTAYDDYLKTDYWKAVAHEVKKRAGWRCQLCNSQHDLMTHHRTYDHRGKEMEHLDDLTCLCRRCHEIFHGKTTHTVVHNHIVTNVEEKQPLPKVPDSVEQANDVAYDMPDYEGDVKLTRALIMRTKTRRGGFTSATLWALGIEGKPKHGWARKLVGRIIPRESYRRALFGRYKYSGSR